MYTRNGVQVRHIEDPPRSAHRNVDDTYTYSHEGEFVRVQIMPPLPQRFEWVRKTNLREAT